MGSSVKKRKGGIEKRWTLVASTRGEGGGVALEVRGAAYNGSKWEALERERVFIPRKFGMYRRGSQTKPHHSSDGVKQKAHNNSDIILQKKLEGSFREIKLGS